MAVRVAVPGSGDRVIAVDSEVSMGTMARYVGPLSVAITVVTMMASAAEASRKAEGGQGQASAPAVVLNGGHDRTSSWLTAEYRELQLRKRTDRATLAVAIELRVGADLVDISVARQFVSVARGGRQVIVDSPEALASVQHLLGGSAAVFGVRAMLSDLEPISALTAPEMALLSTAAFVASLVGDVGAPQRIADRFMAKHRGIFRQVRESGKCWSDYSNEVSAAWDELEGCMADADAKDFFRAAYERLACNGTWLLRTESAWFEYLKCLSPLTVIPQ